MPRIEGTTNAQTKFLRAFRTDPKGPAADKWPSPATLRRWLRRPGFVQAMRSIRDAMRWQADFQLLSAAASAAQGLHEAVATGEGETSRMKAMSDLMKLAHVRQRFAGEDPPKPVRQNVLEELVCTANDNGTIGALLRMYAWHTGRDLKDQYRARMDAMAKAGIGHDPLVMRPLWHNRQDGDEHDHAASDDGPA